MIRSWSLCVAVGLLLWGCATAPEAPQEVRNHEARCDDGDAQACYAAGQYFRASGRVEDAGLAFGFFQRGCELGSAPSCTLTGYFYDHGHYPSADSERAAEFFLKACEMGDATGCTNLGLLYNAGRGVPQDQGTALRFFEMGCERESGRGCTQAGRSHQQGRGTDVDLARAADWYDRGCQLGYAEGCANLGWHYELGRGRQVDHERALRLYQQSCDGEFSRGCVNLGLAYEFGRGTDEDLGQAAAVYEQACELDGARGCERLGRLLVDGKGVDADVERGVAFLERGCELERGEACTELGDLFAEGRGVDQDQERALGHWRTGCERGAADGCMALARASEGEEAAQYFLSGCELSHEVCVVAARSILEIGETDELVAIARQALQSGCEADSYSSCMAKIALRHPSMKEEFEDRCAGGEAGACLHLSRLMTDDESFDALCLQDEREVLDEEAARHACEDGDWEGCWIRGVGLFEPEAALLGMMGGGGGLGTSMSTDERRDHLTETCEGGDLEVCVELGLFLRGLEEYGEARRVLQGACDQGELSACREIGVELVGSDDAEEQERGHVILDELCKEEFFRACLDRAEAIRARDGDEADHETVVTLKQLACRGGDSRACWRIRVYFEERSDSAHHRACAMHYMHGSCELDNWSGCWRFEP